MQVTQQQVQAVQQYAATAAGQAAWGNPALGGQPGMARVVRAAVQAGKVPGYPASWAMQPRHAQPGGPAMHALGRKVRQVPRSAGMGVGRGHNYGTAKVPAAKVLCTANAKAAAAAKAKAKQAARAAQQGAQQPAS